MPLICLKNYASYFPLNVLINKDQKKKERRVKKVVINMRLSN